MKYTVIFTTLLPVLVVAGAIQRDVVTIVETKTVHQTVHRTVHASPHPSGIPPSNGVTAATTSHIPSSTPKAWDANIDYSKLSPYAAPILKQHNLHRENHTAPPLQWDDELAVWAQQIADTCVYAHSNKAGDGEFGQNIGAGAVAEEVGLMITNLMYNGEVNAYPGYDGEPDKTNFHVWSHFSQIVWMNTTSVGCHTTHCNTLQNVNSDAILPYFTVCNYRPPGNWEGQYHEMVLKPIGEASVVL